MSTTIAPSAGPACVPAGGRVHGRSRHAWQLVMNRAVDLLRGRVAAAAPELPEDHQALRCDALAAGVQQLDQITLIVVIGAVSRVSVCNSHLRVCRAQQE